MGKKDLSRDLTQDSNWENVLVCPEDKGELMYIEQENILYNPRLKRKYMIEDGIPVMLIDKSVSVDESEHKRILKIGK